MDRKRERIMNKIFIGLNLLFLTLYSCSPQAGNQSEEITSIEWNSLKETNPLCNAQTAVEFVQLETTDECIINYIKKIESDDDFLFIEDGMQRVYAFNKEGRFMNKIGRKGGATNEYVTLYDFILDREEKKVLLFDMGKRAILSYDYHGNFLSTEKIRMDEFFYGGNIALADGHCILIVNTNEPNMKYNFSLINLNSDERDSFVPYISVGLQCSTDFKGRFGYQSKKLLLRAELSDTIFVYSKGEISPKYVFNGVYRHASINDVKRTYDIGEKAMGDLLDKGLSAGINQLYATDRIIYFTSFINNREYRMFYDIMSKLGYRFDPIKQWSGICLIWNNLIGTTSDAFICEVPVDDIQDETEIRNEYPQLDKLLKEYHDEDNPILAFFYLDC